MLLWLRTAVVVMGLVSAVVGLRGSGLRLNPVTGGYEDISVVVGEELPASSCPQILDNIKVYTGLELVLRIRIHRIHMFLGLPDPLARGMEPDPDPSTIKQNSKKTLDSFLLFSKFF
jgi:hypothetical protein